ncbi:MAG: restriction endonuclease subunit S [Intestinibacter bartlettii]|uniref:restriction endonuclease subunit S n=1 Tax=Intestinibacter bartlettii TaxID=261299 RepID=UPI002EA2D184|nr:restriction endonuclease subunit S [Intestinibacter bartlettii]
MDIQGLKDKILQLAIQGKLVEQCESDEPASVLLDRIKKEKEQLIKAKVIKKEKSLPEIGEDEKLFDLPRGWEWCRLGDISNYIKAGGDKPKTFSSIKNKQYPIPVIGNGKKDKGIVGYTNIATENNACITVSGRGTIGYSCIRKNPFCPIVRLIVICPNIGINISYLNYSLQYFVEQGVGTSIQQLTVPMIKPKVIPLPPLEEQKRIVAKVDELFKLIDELDKNKQDLLENITNTKNKVLQLAIQGKLVKQFEEDEPASVLLERIKKEKEQLIKDKVIKKEKALPKIDEDEKLFDLPRGWEWCRLGDIGIYKKGPFGSALTKSMFVPKGKDTIKVYEQKNAIKKDCTLGDYYVSKEYFESKLKGFEVSAGEIIVSCAGTIGETYILPNNIERGIINQALMKMKIFDGIDIDYFLIYFDFILKKAAKESSKGSAIKNIPPFNILKKMLLAIPPLKEQKRIVSKVDLIMNYLDKLQQEMESKEIVLKKAILTEI